MMTIRASAVAPRLALRGDQGEVVVLARNNDLVASTRNTDIVGTEGVRPELSEFFASNPACLQKLAGAFERYGKP